MRTIIAICAVSLLVGAFLVWRVTQAPKVFGNFASAPTVPVEDLIARPKSFIGKLVAAEGIISEQCKSMGCFFFFQSGKNTLRVELQEIAMTAPMREGHRVRVEGQIVPYGDGYQLYASAVEFK